MVRFYPVKLELAQSINNAFLFGRWRLDQFGSITLSLFRHSGRELNRAHLRNGQRNRARVGICHRGLFRVLFHIMQFHLLNSSTSIKFTEGTNGSKDHLFSKRPFHAQIWIRERLFRLPEALKKNLWYYVLATTECPIVAVYFLNNKKNHLKFLNQLIGRKFQFPPFVHAINHAAVTWLFPDVCRRCFFECQRKFFV